MTNYVISANITKTNPNDDGVNHAGTSDTVTINEEIIVKAEGTDARGVVLDGFTDVLNVNGTATSEKSNGVVIGTENNANSGDNSIFIGTHGGISAESDESSGILAFGDGNLVNNKGLINGGVAGILIQGGAAAVLNFSFVTGQLFGIVVGGGDATVTNSGLVTGLVAGIQTSGNNAHIENSGSVGGTVVGMSLEGETGTIDNSGSILGTLTGLKASNDDAHANTVAGTERITNTGLITGSNGAISTSGDKILIANKAGGFIATANTPVPTGFGAPSEGNSAAVLMDSGSGDTQTLVNDGLIKARTAAVLGGAGVEKVTNNGQIVGSVDLGSGNDLYDGHKGTVSGMVGGGAGTDTLIAGKGHETFSGGADNDSFAFGSAAAAGKGKSRDKITDFSHAEHDKIKLSAIDADMHHKHNQDFTFIGDETFKHYHKDNPDDAGLLRFHKGVISGDVDGDLHADFSITVNTAVVKGDFLL